MTFDLVDRDLLDDILELLRCIPIVFPDLTLNDFDFDTVMLEKCLLGGFLLPNSKSIGIFASQIRMLEGEQKKNTSSIQSHTHQKSLEEQIGLFFACPDFQSSLGMLVHPAMNTGQPIVAS